ncbi:MAG TPA: outer membrane protein assembly factor BamD [Candidatus Acidoferrum sp.]|nr:outer membrane protein assembly factor BamD [Candidatus Acidoferrum sp.]
MRRIPLLLMCAVLLASASQCSAQILHRKKKPNKSTEASNTVEPDKQLYDKAMDDIKHGKQEVGRLSLQTLINTYPDSEYLAKAKLAIADSYFKEGGTSNVTQAVAGYKDFIVFFPFMPEAAYAQMQVAMAHYNEMPKADRDNDHARLAEEEFQTFLQKYPKDPLAPQAQQRLREVQEVLAEGQFRIAYYYYVKGDRRAAAGRLAPLTRRYPLYSKSDSALWMLADIFEKSERKDIAGAYYGLIVRNYPLSKRAADSKGKLKSFGMPIPQPDPKAVAWMTAEQNAPRPHESLVHKPLGIFHPGPDIRMTAVSGPPQMEPESSTPPGTDILSGGSSMTGPGAGKSGIVATVVPGEAAPSGTATTGTATEDVNTAPASDSTNGATPATDPPAATAPDAAAPATSDGTAANPPATGAATSDAAKTDGTAPSSNAAATDSAKADGAPPAADSQNQKESSSKKKGLRKLIPW